MSSNKGKRKVLIQRHVSSRMNFLYQAANLMAHNNNNTLAAYYGKLCRNVGTKSLMHISPALKRTLCKRCSLPLLPGINSTLMLSQQSLQKEPEQEQQTQQEAQQEQKPQQQPQTQKEPQREGQHQKKRRLRRKRKKLNKDEAAHQDKVLANCPTAHQDQVLENYVTALKDGVIENGTNKDAVVDNSAAAFQDEVKGNLKDALLAKNKENDVADQKAEFNGNFNDAVPTKSKDALLKNGLAAQQDAIIDEHAQLQLECSLCRAQRRFLVDTHNECWLERTEAIVQVVKLDREGKT